MFDVRLVDERLLFGDLMTTAAAFSPHIGGE